MGVIINVTKRQYGPWDCELALPQVASNFSVEKEKIDVVKVSRILTLCIVENPKWVL